MFSKSHLKNFISRKPLSSWYMTLLPLELVMPAAIGADVNIGGGSDLVTFTNKTFRSSLLSVSGWYPVILPLQLAALSGGTNSRVGRTFQLAKAFKVFWLRKFELNL